MLRGDCVAGRWRNIVMAALPDGEVICSVGTADYQGQVAIVAKLDDGNWLHYSWSYGSCSSCDAWEDRIYAGDSERAEVDDDIRRGAATMDRDHFADYLVGASDSEWVKALRGEQSWLYEDRTGASFEQLTQMLLRS